MQAGQGAALEGDLISPDAHIYHGALEQAERGLSEARELRTSLESH
jgi:hypothetical protein